LENQVETISLGADELDGDWIYYDSVSRIVVDDVDLEALATEQFEAIRSWVHGGGLILFTSTGLVAEHPYCQKLLGDFPFAAATNLFYLGFYALASLLHIGAVRKSRRRLQAN
jgi:hypothetical protein